MHQAATILVTTAVCELVPVYVTYRAGFVLYPFTFTMATPPDWEIITQLYQTDATAPGGKTMVTYVSTGH